ncbi:hypothetical protein ACFSUS_26665 [Spirosoma soli]|uniref:DUF4249 domain-containing protein n=2 Tax=Spirosoma soli TaxID=1770529 RepID=A0ABW5MCM7_9BACT
MRCSNSSLSTSSVNDPSLLRVNVIISRSTGDGDSLNQTIEAFIRDKSDKTVANPNIQVKVNGKSLRLNNGSSNYYGAYPYYQRIDSSLAVHAETTYTVSVVLTDGSGYTLGTIETQAELIPARFLPPVSHPRKQPLTLHWQDLEPDNWWVASWKRWRGEESVTKLKISKSSRTVDPWRHVQYEGGSTEEADYLSTEVSSGQGAYTIPAAYFQGPTSRFNTLDVMVTSEKVINIDNVFRSGSSISSNRRGFYRIGIVD